VVKVIKMGDMTVFKGNNAPEHFNLNFYALPTYDGYRWTDNFGEVYNKMQKKGKIAVLDGKVTVDVNIYSPKPLSPGELRGVSDDIENDVGKLYIEQDLSADKGKTEALVKGVDTLVNCAWGVVYKPMFAFAAISGYGAVRAAVRNTKAPKRRAVLEEMLDASENPLENTDGKKLELVKAIDSEFKSYRNLGEAKTYSTLRNKSKELQFGEAEQFYSGLVEGAQPPTSFGDLVKRFGKRTKRKALDSYNKLNSRPGFVKAKAVVEALETPVSSGLDYVERTIRSVYRGYRFRHNPDTEKDDDNGLRGRTGGGSEEKPKPKEKVKILAKCMPVRDGYEIVLADSFSNDGLYHKLAEKNVEPVITIAAPADFRTTIIKDEAAFEERLRDSLLDEVYQGEKLTRVATRWKTKQQIKTGKGKSSLAIGGGMLYWGVRKANPMNFWSLMGGSQLVSTLITGPLKNRMLKRQYQHYQTVEAGMERVYNESKVEFAHDARMDSFERVMRESESDVMAYSNAAREAERIGMEDAQNFYTELALSSLDRNLSPKRGALRIPANGGVV